MDILSIDFKFWALQTVGMMLTGLCIPGLKVKGPVGAFLAVAALAYINATYWDWALFFKLPDSVTVKALLLVLTNGVIFWILVKLLPGIEVEGILPALLAPLVFAVLSFVVPTVYGTIDWVKVWAELQDGITFVRTYFENNNLAPSR